MVPPHLQFMLCRWRKKMKRGQEKNVENGTSIKEEKRKVGERGNFEINRRESRE